MSNTKLLFVLSSDFGELANALYLVKDQPFTPVLLLPERLLAMNQGQLNQAMRSYRSVKEILAAVDREQPALVLLFSGYLYGINNLLTLEDTERLVQELRARHCRVVVSDPFLGILANTGPATFADAHPRKEWLTQHFTRLFDLFRDCAHLYLVNPEGLSSTRNVSFFNPAILLDEAGRDALRRRLAEDGAIDPARPRWLFVFSAEDYAGQASRRGRARFDNLLQQKLHETIRAGRQPVVLGPQACIDTLRYWSAAFPGLVLLSFCSHARFMALLLETEYVFYWNIFSNSVPARVVNRLPVFFFDPGHMVHAIRPLAEAGLRYYFAGASLPLLPLEQELRLSELAVHAAAQQPALAQAVSRFQQSPHPVTMVETLLRS